jgi:hypothetical protein
VFLFISHQQPIHRETNSVCNVLALTDVFREGMPLVDVELQPPHNRNPVPLCGGEPLADFGGPVGRFTQCGPRMDGPPGPPPSGLGICNCEATGRNHTGPEGGSHTALDDVSSVVFEFVPNLQKGNAFHLAQLDEQNLK